MNKWFKLFISFFVNFFFEIKFVCYIKKKKDFIFLVIDIDNTVANTWQVLNTLKTINDYEKIPPLTGSISELKNKYKNIPRIYLSNRNIFTYRATTNWLLKYGLFDSRVDILILTAYPQHKLRYLKKLVAKKLKVFYYDDLSYNHEFGNVFFYDKIIAEVKKLNINYFDNSYILNLNVYDTPGSEKIL